MAILETVTSLASQHFLNPIGLLALLGLIPLIIFYLIKPKPEEHVMPSMMFFMKDRSKGKVSQAIKTLMRNLLLLLHILFVVGLAAAIAQPHISGFQKPDNAVVVFDASASMSDDMELARNFVGDNLGEENTLIIVDRDVSVPLEDASARQVKRYLQNLESQDVETNIAGGIETAREYEGQIVVASDMDQTVNAREVKPLINEIQQDREVKVIEATKKNSWGIINVEPGKENSTIDIKNFQDEDAEIAVQTNNGGQRINVDSGTVETITVEMETGTNTIELEDDGSNTDNKAHISVPEEKNFKVMHIADGENADQENPYFAKAVDLIPFTTYEYVSTPINKELNADIYVVGKTNDILPDKAKEIERQVKNGAGLVLFAQNNLVGKGFESAPEVGDRRNASVEILEPIRANVGQTQVYDLQGSGLESMSTPDNAVVKKQHGEGEVVIYNVADEDFRHNFLYPIFWKEVFSDLTERPSINEINIETGDTISEPQVTKPNGETVSGPITALKTGYYEASGKTYAVNLESEDESNVDGAKIDSNSLSEGEAKQNAQHLAAVLLAILAVLELIYLMRIGEFE